MKKLSQYLVACFLAIFSFMPTNAFADYALTMANSYTASLMPSTAYFFNSGNGMDSFSSSTNVYKNYTNLIVPHNGTITSVYGGIFTGSAASSENCTINIIQNYSMVRTVTNTLALTGAGYNSFGTNSLNIPVNAGDVLQVEIVTPNWVLAPISSSFSVSIYIQ